MRIGQFHIITKDTLDKACKEAKVAERKKTNRFLNTLLIQNEVMRSLIKSDTKLHKELTRLLKPKENKRLPSLV